MKQISIISEETRETLLDRQHRPHLCKNSERSLVPLFAYLIYIQYPVFFTPDAIEYILDAEYFIDSSAKTIRRVISTMLHYGLVDGSKISGNYGKVEPNSQISLLPLYVYLVLGKYSSRKKHLTHQEIADYIKKDYDLSVGRSTMGRVISTILDDGVCSVTGVKFNHNSGLWID